MFDDEIREARARVKARASSPKPRQHKGQPKWYAGVLFDSGNEASWAKRFDKEPYVWEFHGRDPVGIHLGGELHYKIDFWLPTFGYWLEIKPGGRDPRDELLKYRIMRRKVRAGELPGRDVLLIVGGPSSRNGGYFLNRLRREAAER